MKKSWKRAALFMLAGAMLALGGISAALLLSHLGVIDGIAVLRGEEYRGLNAVRPVAELMKLIESEQYGEETDPDTLLSGALSGMLKSTGDRYTAYYSKEEYAEYLENLSGKYTGIGALISLSDEKNGVVVLRVYSGGAADAAGVMPGDRIVAVDGQPVLGIALEEVRAVVQGEVGTTVRLTLLRGERELTLPVVRTKSVLRRVEEGVLLQGNVGYLRVDSFTGECVSEFQSAIDGLRAKGMQGLIIDLRNNPGGELDRVVEMADMVLEEGIILTVRYAGGEETQYRAEAPGLGLPLVVLVNENSASASEVFAGAVQKNDAGRIVGKKTYGKGVVQSTKRLASNEGWAKMTIAAYFLADETSVEGVGLTPDVEAEAAEGWTDPYIDGLDPGKDAQLNAALETIEALVSK